MEGSIPNEFPVFYNSVFKFILKKLLIKTLEIFYVLEYYLIISIMVLTLLTILHVLLILTQNNKGFSKYLISLLHSNN